MKSDIHNTKNRLPKRQTRLPELIVKEFNISYKKAKCNVLLKKFKDLL